MARSGCSHSCDAWSLKCVAKGEISVSWCKCVVLVSCVHPVMAHSALFCVICCFYILVLEVMGEPNCIRIFCDVSCDCFVYSGLFYDLPCVLS